MKNIRMAYKLGIGFGIVLLCTGVLGSVALNQMNFALTESEYVARKALPEVTELNALERSFRAATLSIRSFTLRENQQAYEESQKHFADAHKAQAKLQALADKYPELEKLRAFLPPFEKALLTYENLSRQSGESMLRVSALRQNMGKDAQNALSNLHEIRQAIFARAQQDIRQGDSINTLARLENVDRVDSIISAIMEVRMFIWQAQLQGNAELLLAARRKMDAQKEVIDKVSAALITESARQNVINAQASLQSYIDSITAMDKAWLDMGEFARKSLAASEEATALLAQGADDVLAHVMENSVKNMASTETNKRYLLITLASITLLGAGVALLLTRLVTVPLRQSMVFAQAVAQGSLNETLAVQSRDEVGKLADALRAMVEALKAKIAEATSQAEQARKLGDEAAAAMRQAQEAQAAAENAKREGMLAAARQLEGIVAAVSSASTQLSVQVEESERGAGIVADRLGETATAMEEMNATVLEVARSAGGAAEVSTNAKAKAERGAAIVGEVVVCINNVESQSAQLKEDMVQLGQQAESIGTIMNVISDIADQTNLLALNAAIEAARAGDAGRGFAVVADEVRKLAEKTMQATVEVGNAIKGVQESAGKNMQGVDASSQVIEKATELVRQAGESLSEIVGLVESSADQVRTIATAAEQQSSTSEEINRSLGAINSAATDSSRAMAEATQAVSALTEQAHGLVRIIDDMKNN